MSNTPPAWLEALVDDITPRFRSYEPVGPIGCHFFFDPEDEQWEITMFVSRTEVMGGPTDGRITESRFFFDLLGLENLLDSVETISWQAQWILPDDEIGPHLSIGGIYDGHRVWLRLPASEPPSFSAGRLAAPMSGHFEDLW